MTLVLGVAVPHPLDAQAPGRGAAPASTSWTVEDHRELVRTMRGHIGVPENWTPRRTSWGQPDIDGAWTSDGVVGIPRERPARFGQRRWLTEEEFAAREKAEKATRERAAQAIGFGNSANRDRAWRGDITFRLTSLIVAPETGRTPALTPEARNRTTTPGSFGPGPFNSPADFTLFDRCITRGVVGSILPTIYGNGSVIVQTPEHFVISYEMIHDTRVVPVDDRPRLRPGIRQLLGDARGRWAGDTLIVETTNLTDKTLVGGVPHSASMRLVEHFTPVADGVLLYDVTIDDPGTYARPWTIAVPLVSPPGFRPLPYQCHEGNGVVEYSLSGDRQYKREVQEALSKGLPPPPRSSSDNTDIFRPPVP